MSPREVTCCENCEHCVGCVDRVLNAESGAMPLEEDYLHDVSLRGNDPYDAELQANPEERQRVMSQAGERAWYRF